MPQEALQNQLDEDSITPMEKSDKQDNPLKKPEEKDQGEKIDDKHLNPGEITDLKENRITMPELVSKREKLKQQAQIRLKELTQVTGIFSKSTIISPKEQMQLQRELEEKKGPGQIEDFMKKLAKIQKDKEDSAKDGKKERSPDAPELLDLQKKFDALCDKPGVLENPQKFKDWFKSQRHETPTLEHLQKLLDQNENDIHGNTIAKREATYNKLQDKFKQYDIQDAPTKNKYLRENGFEEREAFLTEINKLEKHYQNVNPELYSREMIKLRMQTGLMETGGPTALKKQLIDAQELQAKEDEAFTDLHTTKVEIQGKYVNAMSAASIKELLDFYKNPKAGGETDPKKIFELRKTVDFKALIKNEGELAKKLEGVYTDEKTRICDKEGLHKALGTFEKMDFLQKQKAIEDHKELVKDKSNKEVADNVETKGKALLAINKAFTDNNISQITKGKYDTLFNDPTKFKNKKTGKPGDSEEMKKAYETLISPTPIKEKENRNLKAYELERNLFLKDIEKLKKLNPDISEEEIKKWQDKYDKGTWSDREHIQKTEFPSEIFKAQLEANKRKQIEDKVGIKEDEKDKEKVVSLELHRTIKAAQELMSNDQGAEAMKLLLEYNEKEPDNPKILFWIETAGKYMKEFGTGKKKADTQEKIMEDEMERMAQSDEHLKQGLQKVQAFDKNIKGARLSEDRHNKKIDATERSQEESLSHVQSGSVEADLTKYFYKETKGEGFTLNKEGKGDKVRTIQFKENDQMTNENLQKLRKDTEKDQTKLDTKEGITKVQVLNQQGEKVSAKDVGAKLQEQQEEKLAKEIAAKAKENLKRKSGQSETMGAKVFDLNAEMMARRKAQELIEKRKHERIKNAA